MRDYTPRAMPTRYMQGAPAIVRKNVIDLIQVIPPAPLDYDIVLRPDPAPFHKSEIVGLDFDQWGARGCHFFLEAHEARAYRERNRRKRIAWQALPEKTQQAIVAYLES